MIALQDFFDNYAPILRGIGNQRHAYSILVLCEPELVKSYEVGMAFCVDKDIFCTNGLAKTWAFPGTEMQQTSIENLADNVLSCTKKLCIVVADKVLPQHMPMFNEVHCYQSSLPGFNCTGSYQDAKDNTMYMHVRALIDTTDIVAINNKHLKQLGIAKNLGELQPWHTLLLNKANGELAKVVWDTREFTALTVLNEQEIKEALQSSYANDNSMYLYAYDNFDIPETSTFKPYIIDILNV